MAPASSREISVRDPLHGDIVLDPIAAAVVDTKEFQRLRYIRQNGLLHFVFPGAVHTRFAHSLGTYFLARQVEEVLLRPLRKRASEGERPSIEYVATAFRLAALLHDVGHTAFSHSIEHVEKDKVPYLGTLGERFRRWGLDDLLTRYLNAHTGSESQPLHHEQISLAMIENLFRAERVVATAKEAGYCADDLRTDVQALIDGAMTPSDRLLSDQVLKTLLENADFPCTDEKKLKKPISDLFGVLHSLVSGTLDVDRLDYLNRDSLHCGVTYGSCDPQLLIAALQLVRVDGRIELGLHARAAHALDDMLWSRFQLFIQVLNHKTNVALNALLQAAILAADEEGRFQQPVDYSDLLGFTDDLVMSTVRSHVLRGKSTGTPYAKALVNREIPRHLGVVRGPSVDVEKQRTLIASGHNLDEAQIIVGVGESRVIKFGGTPLPWILRRDRTTRAWEPFEKFDAFSTLGIAQSNEQLSWGHFVEHHFFLT